MAKVLRCREVGLDCDFVARGDSEQEVLGKAAEHARKDHGMANIPPEVLMSLPSPEEIARRAEEAQAKAQAALAAQKG